MTRAWIDVDQGNRDLDWHVAIGDLATVPDVTPLGCTVGVRVADDLEAFFGPGWLAKAAPPRTRSSISGLGRYWPSLGLAGAFANVVGLWASLKLLTNERVPGVRELRRSLRTNLQEVSFQHSLTQARLAAQGVVSGHRVTLEPRKPDGDPGDLALAGPGVEVFLEIKTFNPARSFTEIDERVAMTMEFLRQLEAKYDVHWSGDLGGLEEEVPARHEHLRSAAVAARDTGQPQVLGQGPNPLTATPGAASVGNELSGPAVYSDHGTRLVRDLSKKAIQTHAAGAAWIWVQDNDNALWPMSPFAQMPMPSKIKALSDLVGSLFGDHPHLVGIALTSASMPGGTVANETEQTSAGFGFRRALPGSRMRESIVLHRRLVVPGQLNLVAGLCSDEPMWLDGALSMLGIPGGIASLTTFGTRQRAQRRTDSGLYLP